MSDNTKTVSWELLAHWLERCDALQAENDTLRAIVERVEKENAKLLGYIHPRRRRRRDG